jgi:phospholipid-binding lipoprotein MlaA
MTLRWAIIMLVSLTFAGCASTNLPSQRSAADPWQGWNRKVYSFNDTIDGAVLKPVAKAYVAVVPSPVRTGVHNFYGNFSDAWSAVNNLLQGKFSNSLQDLMRVQTNTIFGLVGLVDVASDLGLNRQGEDFGQTMGYWGVGAGPYMVLPLLGPSSLRESVAWPVDTMAAPAQAFQNQALKYTLTGVGVLNTRANLLGATSMVDQMALDKYSFIRDAYLQRRRSLVFDGNEPEPAAEPTSAP